MKSTCIILAASLLSACTALRTAPRDPWWDEAYEQMKYREGARSANFDLKKGILSYETIECEEGESARIHWCYAKLLSEKYNVDYRVISPSLIPCYVGRAKGYNSVSNPIIIARLGIDWQNRIFAEAERYYRANKRKVERLQDLELENNVCVILYKK